MGENLAIISKGYLSLSDHERMSRGITLHEREAIKLARILVQRLQMDGPEQPAQKEYDEPVAAEGGGLF